MKKVNKEKIKTLLLYCTQQEVAEMLGITEWAFIYRLKTWNFDERHEKLISKLKPMKQIVLILSSQFMKNHPRTGEPTYFKEKIELAVLDGEQPHIMCDSTAIMPKLHTIRAKYKEWEAKIAKVNRGEAFLRVVTWAGEPYRSAWVDVCILTKDSGVGVQEIRLDARNVGVYPIIVTRADGSTTQIDPPYIAKNDGLSLVDMVAWFKGYDLAEPLALIQFTKFRY